MYCIFIFRLKKKSKIDDQEKYNDIEKNIMKRKAQLYEIEQTLPKKNSLYLNVSIIIDPSLITFIEL